MTGSRKVEIALLGLVLLATSCGGDDAVSTTSTAAPPPTSTTTAPAVTTTAAVATTTTTTTAVVTTTTTTAAPRAALPPGAMLITNEDGVYVATLDGVASQVIAASPAVVGGMVDFAIDDTRGGIIFQPNHQSWIFTGADSIIYWVPQGAADYQQLLVPAADQGLSLEDIDRQGDAVMVYYTRVIGGTPDTAIQTLRRFDLDAKTVAEVGVVGGWESGAIPISVGGETIVVNGAGEAFFWINFSDLGGIGFESAANPMPAGGTDCLPECFYYGDLSPDGTQVAFGRLAPNSDGFPVIPEIEVRNVATGALVMSVTLPGLSSIGFIDSLDLSDGFVLINVVEEGSVYPMATVVDIASGGITTYAAPVEGVARFLRSIPDLEGVVSWP